MSRRIVFPCVAIVFASAEFSPAAPTAKGLEAIAAPDGFVVEIAAGPPQIERPLMGGFDEQGRLFVAESAGLNLDAKELLERTPNFVRRLVDADGDGRFETSTVFADKMTFPMGALPYRGALYVASPPYIWRLADEDDDGVADSREILVGRFGFIGNAADVHGCFLGPNGRIYWCDGRHGHEFLDEQGRIVSQGKAARIFSCRLDGSNVLAHCGGGMDNPVEVDFTPQGEMLGTVNLFYQKRGDCLVHWLWGGAYPRSDQPLQIAEFKRTGDLLGPVHDFGHVAVSGLLRYRGSSLGDAFVGTASQATWFVCEFNTHKVVRVVVERSGASFSARVEDFLTSDDPDFHPTDVIEDADGSLLVVDTGGWFRNGCPTSVVAKPEALGAIYRLRRTGAAAPADPRGRALSWDDAPAETLLERLSDPRPAVVERAVDLLAQRGDPSVNPLLNFLQSPPNDEAAVRAVWALARIGSPAAVFALVQSGLQQAEDARLASLVALQTADVPESLGPALFAELYKAARSGNRAIEREAATTLGRLGRPEAVPVLLESLENAGYDRPFEHAVLYALIELNDPQRTRAGLAHRSSSVRRGALIALDQMPSGDLQRQEVASLLSAADPELQNAALAVFERRPGWAEEALAFVREQLAGDGPDDSLAPTLQGVLVAFRNDASAQALVGDMLRRPLAPASKRLLLEAIAQSELPECPQSWRYGLEQALADPDDDVALAAAYASVRDPSLRDAAARLAADVGRTPALRAAAAVAAARTGGAVDPTCFDLLLDQLDPNRPPLDRRAAAEALAAASLDEKQKERLVDALRAAGPVEAPALIRVFEREPYSPSLGLRLAEALKASQGLASLSADRIIEIFSTYPEEARAAADELVHALDDDHAQRAERVREILSQAPRADPQRGHAVFNGAKAACASCHSVAGEGGRIGPDLSKIGAAREPRVLIESIVFPSASLARGYESYNVLTEDGRVLSGLIVRETPDALWLRTEGRSEFRIPRDQIEEIQPSRRSVMPEGLDRLLTKEELADLVAYLESLK
jgi:putative membrane-bound dehydrogenase-like protein